MRRILGGLGFLTLVGSVMVSTTGCGGGDNKDAAVTQAAAVTAVNVTLKEFEIVPATTSVQHGSVTFHAKNEGPEEKHEMVVVPTDLAPNALPADNTGKVDEEKLGTAGEIGELEVGATGEVTLHLQPGKYVLICNIVEDKNGTSESHYTNGMRTAFTVK